MRAYLPAYELRTPTSLAETLELLAEQRGAWKLFAGGTDLMVLLEAGKLPHRNYINIWNLTELRGINVTDDYIDLGSLTTYSEVQADARLHEEFPMLGQAASETGGLAIQNRGTLGGNIVNASPAADSPPALLAYDAEVELISTSGARWIAYRDFHTGYKQMAMEPRELLARIRLRRNQGLTHQYYQKVGTRKAQAISKVCIAAVARMNGLVIDEVRIAFGSVAPVPLRCVRTEDVLRGRRVDVIAEDAMTLLAREIVPIDDIRSTRQYRLQVSLNLLKGFLQSLAPGK